MIRKSARLLFLAAGALFLGACDDSLGSDSGRLSILLTDAPGDFQKAVVTIDQIYLQAGEQDDASSRVVLMDEPATVDLLELRNVAMDLVDEAVVPSGSYSQLRLVISGGYVEVVEAEDEAGVATATRVYASSPAYAAAQGVQADGSLQMPSFAQSGLKINLPGGSVRVDGDQTILLLDFDVAESFGQQAGQSGSWVLSPVIRASDLELTSSVELSLSLAEGVTLPAAGDAETTLASFAATLDKGGDVLTEQFALVDGVYRVTFRFLVPGTYPVSLSAPEGVSVTLDQEFPETVTVASGATLRQAFQIVEAAAQE